MAALQNNTSLEDLTPSSATHKRLCLYLKFHLLRAKRERVGGNPDDHQISLREPRVGAECFEVVHHHG